MAATDRLAEAYEAVASIGVEAADEAEARTLLRELEQRPTS